MADERPDWKWYERAREAVAAGDLDAAEQPAAEALAAGHLWRVSLFLSPVFDPLRGRPRFEEIAAEARNRVDALHLKPKVLVATPDHAGAAPLLLVLHGARGNAAEELERWRPATDLGFTVAAAQSSQPATANGFCWDPPRERVSQDLKAIASMLPPHARMVLAGYSQGAWVAINAALSADIVVAGTVVMVAPFAGQEPQLPGGWRRLKVSILIGERDMYLASVEQFAQQLRDRDHHVSLEVIPNLGHAYPRDFNARLPLLLRP